MNRTRSLPSKTVSTWTSASSKLRMYQPNPVVVKVEGSDVKIAWV